jgi:nudix-type nucleoside diphosphatase (YffH/AdpP family)
MRDPARDRVTIRCRETLSENFYRLEKVTFDYVRQDGSRQALAREVYHNGPGACVLPVDPARGTVLLIRQLRIPAYVNGDPPLLIEVCAGMIDAGDDPTATVRKEIEQETGYRLHAVRKLFELYMSPGASAEKLHLFVAQYGSDDHVGQGGGVRAEGEEIELLEMPLARAWEMVRSGAIVDAKTVLLLQHVRAGAP